MKSSSVTGYVLIGLILLAPLLTSFVALPHRRVVMKGVVQSRVEQAPAFIVATPEEAARQLISQNPEPGVADSFTIRGTRGWWGGVVVLYNAFRAADAQLPAMPLQGYVIVEQAPGGWFARGDGAGRLSTSSEELVDFETGGGVTAHGEYNILDGQVLSSNVVAVEATFDDGQVRRDEADDEVFAFVTPGHVIACELCVLGANEQVLRRIDLTQFPNTAARKFRCPGSGTFRQGAAWTQHAVRPISGNVTRYLSQTS